MVAKDDDDDNDLVDYDEAMTGGDMTEDYLTFGGG